MGFLSFFTFCVRLRCVLFFSCTIKVPFLIKNVYQNGTSRLIIYKNPPLVKPFFNFFYNISLYKEHLFCYTTNTPKERNCLYETSLHYYPLGNLHMFMHDSCPRLSFVFILQGNTYCFTYSRSSFLWAEQLIHYI